MNKNSNKKTKQQIGNLEYGYVKYNEMDEVIDKLYDAADILGIEHPDKNKEYEKLSVPETLSDIANSVGVEASHVLVPKDKEKQYDSKTKAGEISKYVYRYGAQFLPVIGLARNIGKISKLGKIFNIFKKGKASKIESATEQLKKDNPFFRFTIKGKSAPENKPVPQDNKPNTNNKTESAQIKQKSETDIQKNSDNIFENKKTDFNQQNENKPDTNIFRKGQEAIKEILKRKKHNDNIIQQEKKNTPSNTFDSDEFFKLPKDSKNKSDAGQSDLTAYAQLSSSEIKSLTNYHRALGEVFDANNSEMVNETLNSPEYKEVQRLSEYGYSPVETSELFTRVNKIDLKDYSKNGITAYDTLYDKLSTTTILGKTMKQALKDLVSSEKYQNAPDYNPDVLQDSKVSLVDDIFINYTNHARNRLILNEPDYVNKQGMTLGQVEENRLEQKRAARLQERMKKNHEFMKYFV